MLSALSSVSVSSLSLPNDDEDDDDKDEEDDGGDPAAHRALIDAARGRPARLHSSTLLLPCAFFLPALFLPLLPFLLWLFRAGAFSRAACLCVLLVAGTAHPSPSASVLLRSSAPKEEEDEDEEEEDEEEEKEEKDEADERSERPCGECVRHGTGASSRVMRRCVHTAPSLIARSSWVWLTCERIG